MVIGIAVAFNLLLLPLVTLGFNIFDENNEHHNFTASYPYKIINGNLYRIDDGIYNDARPGPSHDIQHQYHTSPNTRQGSRQKEVWDFISTFDSYKTSASYTNVNGKPTLTKFKYIIVPIWWSDMDTSDPDNAMDPDKVVASFIYNQQYYIDMSWGILPNGVTFQALEQQLFTVSSEAPNFGETDQSTRDLLDSKGFVKGVDYDGICLMYFLSQSGPFSGKRHALRHSLYFYRE